MFIIPKQTIINYLINIIDFISNVMYKNISQTNSQYFQADFDFDFDLTQYILNFTTHMYTNTSIIIIIVFFNA